MFFSLGGPRVETTPLAMARRGGWLGGGVGGVGRGGVPIPETVGGVGGAPRGAAS